MNFNSNFDNEKIKSTKRINLGDITHKNLNEIFSANNENFKNENSLHYPKSIIKKENLQTQIKTKKVSFSLDKKMCFKNKKNPEETNVKKNIFGLFNNFESIQNTVLNNNNNDLNSEQKNLNLNNKKKKIIKINSKNLDNYFQNSNELSKSFSKNNVNNMFYQNNNIPFEKSNIRILQKIKNSHSSGNLSFLKNINSNLHENMIDNNYNNLNKEEFSNDRHIYNIKRYSLCGQKDNNIFKINENKNFDNNEKSNKNHNFSKTYTLEQNQEKIPFNENINFILSGLQTTNELKKENNYEKNQFLEKPKNLNLKELHNNDFQKIEKFFDKELNSTTKSDCSKNKNSRELKEESEFFNYEKSNEDNKMINKNFDPKKEKFYLKNTIYSDSCKNKINNHVSKNLIKTDITINYNFLENEDNLKKNQNSILNSYLNMYKEEEKNNVNSSILEKKSDLVINERNFSDFMEINNTINYFREKLDAKNIDEINQFMNKVIFMTENQMIDLC